MLNGSVEYITFLQPFLCPGPVGKETGTPTSDPAEEHWRTEPLDSSINWMRLHYLGAVRGVGGGSCPFLLIKLFAFSVES